MKIFMLILKIWPLLVEAVQLAEVIFTTPKTGAEKKSAVMEQAKEMIMQIGGVFTGGALETWKMIEPFIDKAIDFIVAVTINDNK